MNSKSKVFRVVVILFVLIVFQLAAPGLIYALKGPVISEVVELVGIDERTKIEVEISPEYHDNSAYLGISARVFNTGSSICRVEGNINDTPWNGGCVWLDPGESETMEILFKRGLVGGERCFPNMHGLPGGAMDALFIDKPDSIHKLSFEVYVNALTSLRIAEIRPFGKFIHPTEMAAKKDFFPFIDQYGQYIHGEWPGKITSDLDFEESIRNEEKELSCLPEPESRNRFGSWLGGPRLEATGHFRVEKVDGQR